MNHTTALSNSKSLRKHAIPGPRKPLNFQTSDAGWSLIEIIVAVSILLLLATLVFNIAGNARDRSESMRCQSNLRETGMATMLYITDREGHLLPSKHWYSRVSSQGGMRDYLMEPTLAYAGSYNFDTILTCHTIKRLDPDSFPVYMNRGFSLNRYMLNKDPASRYDKDESTRPALRGGPLVLNNIPNPSAMWMFMDTGRSYATNLPMEYDLYQLFFPHGGKTNLVYADLRVDSLDNERLRNPPSKREFWGDLDLTD